MDTLDSVPNQTYDYVDDIVMNGESRDGTVEILEEYK
jgi:glycosyltransferase involved in cell wall biosynthesis